MPLAGELTPEQAELLFTHLPLGISFSVADEDDIVRFWTGDAFAFSGCNPKLIGRTVNDCHPRRLHAQIDELLADLKSGAKDVWETIERSENGAERVIYTALRDAEGTYRGVLETVLPIDEA